MEANSYYQVFFTFVITVLIFLLTTPCMRTRILFFLFFVFTFLATRPVMAQVFMQPFENAANMAIGGASVAFEKPENGVTNPAQLGAAPRLGVYAWSAVPYGISGWQSHGFQAMTRIDRSSGVNIGVLHSGIEGYTEQRFQADYGRKLGEKVSLGGSIQAMRVSASEYGNAMGYTFAVGVTALPLPKLTIGASIQNPFSQQIAGSTTANVLRLGAKWQPSDIFLITTEIGKDLERPFQIKAGLEYHPVPVLRLRAGVRTQPSRSSFGAGLVLKNGPRIDFGAEWHPTLGLSPAAMLAWTIK